MDWLTVPAPFEERGWRAWTDYGVEQETAAFLYGLVRLLRPARVIESGTGEGYAAMALAQAVADNGCGTFDTYEPDDGYRRAASKRLSRLVSPGLSCDHEPGPFDIETLVFLDSYGDERPREIAYWRDKPVWLAVHDSREHKPHLPPGGICFPTPRGLWIRPRI